MHSPICYTYVLLNFQCLFSKHTIIRTLHATPVDPYCVMIALTTSESADNYWIWIDANWHNVHLLYCDLLTISLFR